MKWYDKILMSALGLVVIGYTFWMLVHMCVIAERVLRGE